MLKEELKAIRQAKNLSQAEMGIKMGLTENAYSKKERGIRPITNQDRVILQYLNKLSDRRLP